MHWAWWLLIAATLLGVGVLIFLILVRRLLARILDHASTALETLPTPPRIHLEADPSPPWTDKEAVRASVQSLRQVGFEEVGSFSVPEMPQVHMVGLVHAEERAYGIVYEHAVAGVWTDIVTEYQDGTSETWANLRATMLDPRPGHAKHYLGPVAVADLWKQFQAERSKKPALPVSTEEFVLAFEHSYAEEMDWRNSRGGPSEDEIRRQSEAMGDMVGAEALHVVHTMMGQAAVNDYQETLRTRFSQHHPEHLSYMNELLFVYDTLSPSQLVELTAAYLKEDPDGVALRLPSGPPRSAFEEFNRHQHPIQRFTHIGRMDGEVPVDVYRSPAP